MTGVVLVNASLFVAIINLIVVYTARMSSCYLSSSDAVLPPKKKERLLIFILEHAKRIRRYSVYLLNRNKKYFTDSITCLYSYKLNFTIPILLR